jgi:heat shock protein HslJ
VPSFPSAAREAGSDTPRVDHESRIELFASFAITASGQPATHSSGFPIGSQFAVDAIDGKPSGNRPRTFAMQVARNGNPYAIGFGGCHGWFGQIAMLDRGEIKVESVDTTQGEPQGPCEPEEQKIEDRFLTLLKEAVRWRAEGPTLILESGSGSIHLAKR